jgi:hypothetical protein
MSRRLVGAAAAELREPNLHPSERAMLIADLEAAAAARARPWTGVVAAWKAWGRRPERRGA